MLLLLLLLLLLLSLPLLLLMLLLLLPLPLPLRMCLFLCRRGRGQDTLRLGRGGRSSLLGRGHAGGLPCRGRRDLGWGGGRGSFCDGRRRRGRAVRRSRLVVLRALRLLRRHRTRRGSWGRPHLVVQRHVLVPDGLLDHLYSLVDRCRRPPQVDLDVASHDLALDVDLGPGTGHEVLLLPSPLARQLLVVGGLDEDCFRRDVRAGSVAADLGEGRRLGGWRRPRRRLGKRRDHGFGQRWVRAAAVRVRVPRGEDGEVSLLRRRLRRLLRCRGGGTMHGLVSAGGGGSLWPRRWRRNGIGPPVRSHPPFLKVGRARLGRRWVPCTICAAVQRRLRLIRHETVEQRQVLLLKIRLFLAPVQLHFKPVLVHVVVLDPAHFPVQQATFLAR
mmetsp:Transcript_11586/g.27203  ORF Transcript_11586/g.27203 Transcript_11586/m.27203 type:complete len:387 (-) Transcript_11586:2393-3553(-)